MLDALTDAVVALANLGTGGESGVSLKIWNDEPECPESLIK